MLYSDLERYLILSLIMDQDSIGSVRDLLGIGQMMGGDERILYSKILDMEQSGERVDRFSLYMSGVLPHQRIEKMLTLDIEGVILEPERLARFILKRNLEEKFLQAAQDKDPEYGKELSESLINLENAPEWKAISELSTDQDSRVIFTTGFRFDDYVNLHPEDLCIIAGRTGIGKSTIGMNMLSRISREYPVGLISFEMGERGVAKRLIQSMSPSEIGDAPYYVAFPSAFNLSIVRRTAKEMITKKGVKVLMIDYLQLMSETKKFNSRHLEVSFIVRQLKEIAKQMNLLVILICQLSRALDARGDKSRPILGDLKESGDIEYAADAILFLHRSDDMARETELIIAKNRYGKKAIVNLVFMPERAMYGNATTVGYDSYSAGGD